MKSVDAATQPRLEGSIRKRAFALGISFAAFIGLALPYNVMIVKGTHLGLSVLTPAAFFLLFILSFCINPVLRRWSPSWSLRPREQLLVFAMSMVATAVPTRGVTGMLLSMIAGPHYYASPENQWPDLVIPHLKPWMTVGGSEGLRHFYEGVGPGETADWAVWLQPLFCWFLFVAALWVGMLCLTVIVRKQWVEHERLSYPLMQVPLAMVADDGRAIPPFFRSRLMWVGFSIPFLLGTLESIHHYYPAFPALVQSVPRLDFWGGAISLVVRLNPMMFGFAYLVNTKLSLSLWFFYLLSEFVEGGFSVIGLGNPEQLGPWTNSGQVEPIFAHQSMGAMIALVGFGIWSGREHLKEVWSEFRNPAGGDTGEMISYRHAVVGLAVGTVVMVGWLWRSGIPLWISPFVVVTSYVLFFALTRAIVDGGLATIVPAMVPLGVTLSAFGTEALGVVGVVALSFTLVWAGDLLMFAMAPAAHAVRVAGDPRAGGGGRIFWGLLAAMTVSLLVSISYMIDLGHQEGAANLYWQYFKQFSRYPGDFAVKNLMNPSPPNIGGWMWTGVGALVMGGLTLAMYRLPRWPFHPIGYMVSPSWIMGSLWFPFLLAWVLKSLVLRYGSLELYDRSRQAVYGIILGNITVAGFWLVVDALTGTSGNMLRVY